MKRAAGDAWSYKWNSNPSEEVQMPTEKDPMTNLKIHLERKYLKFRLQSHDCIKSK